MLSPVGFDPRKLSPARLFSLLALVPLLLLGGQSLAAPITVPTGLAPGQSYRLAFVTAGTRDASNVSSWSNEPYDAFVTAEANTELSLSSIQWQVLGSGFNGSTYVRQHTGTTPASWEGGFPGVPIFLLNDTKLVDDYADLWDGTFDTSLSIDQHGNTLFTEVWTGMTASGFSGEFSYLGCSDYYGACAQYGSSQAADSAWAFVGYDQTSSAKSYYAISNVLTVPGPTPAALLTLGFAALLLVRRVRAV